VKALFYDWGGLNLWLFQTINGWRGVGIDDAMLWVSRWGDPGNFSRYAAAVAATAVVLVARARRHGSNATVTQTWLSVLAVLLLASAIDSVLVGWLKSLLAFPRPASANFPGVMYVVGTPVPGYSLPSGHATFAMGVAASLWPVAQRMRWGLAAWVLLVGVSRINLGVHFPADVLAGFLLALTVVGAIRVALQRLWRDVAGTASN
jgi:membrane-associated phospholipid phosphatase